MNVLFIEFLYLVKNPKRKRCQSDDDDGVKFYWRKLMRRLLVLLVVRHSKNREANKQTNQIAGNNTQMQCQPLETGWLAGTRKRVADVTMSHVRHSLHSLLAHVHRTYTHWRSGDVFGGIIWICTWRWKNRTNIQHYGGHFSMTTLSSAVAVRSRYRRDFFSFCFFFFAKWWWLFSRQW